MKPACRFVVLSETENITDHYGRADMNMKLNLVPLAAMGLAVFTVHASAQLLGGGLHGTLDGALRDNAAGGLLDGSAQADGGLRGSVGGGLHDATGRVRESTRETAGKVRDGVGSAAQRTREASTQAVASARSGVEGVRQSASETSTGAEGSMKGAAGISGPRGDVRSSGRADTVLGREGVMASGDIAASGELPRKAAAPEESSSGQ
jgi:hypothetical protein